MGEKLWRKCTKAGNKKCVQAVAKLSKRKYKTAKFLKAGTEGRDNLVSATLSFLFKNIP